MVKPESAHTNTIARRISRNAPRSCAASSARWSRELNRVIGMAWIPAEFAEDGTVFYVTVDGGFEKATVHLRPFFDPDGERLRS